MNAAPLSAAYLRLRVTSYGFSFYFCFFFAFGYGFVFGRVFVLCLVCCRLVLIVFGLTVLFLSDTSSALDMRELCCWKGD